MRKWSILATIIGAGVAVLAGAASVSAADQPPADDRAALTVRMTQQADLNTVELGLTWRPGFRVFTLADPMRVVVDFPELDWRISAPRSGQTIRYIDGVRFGLVRPGTSRMVVDLRRPARVKRAYTLAADGVVPPRFILELASIDKATFNATAGWPDREEVPIRTAEAPWPPAPLPRPRRGIVVAIDPGHGGQDPGAAHDDTLEKDLVLGYALEMAAVIDARPGYRAVLTRDDDQFLSLRERVTRARRAGADLMLSIHADALERGIATGATVFTLSEDASDEEAAALAVSHNRADVIAGVRFDEEPDDIALVLVDLARRATDAASRTLAAALVSELEANSQTLEGRALQSAGFRVLKAPDMPSVLVELGFLSSAEDRARLLSPEGRANLITALTDGVFAWSSRQKGARFDAARRLQTD